MIRMTLRRFLSARRRVWLFGIVSVLLALGLTLHSVTEQRSQDPLCEGQLGAGFPMTFLCDTTGSSPTSSWGKIDEADYFFPTPFFWADVLFYAALLWTPWVLAHGISCWRRRRL